MKNIDEVDEIFVRTFNGSNDSVNAETRSAPGDLQKPSSSREFEFLASMFFCLFSSD